LPSFGRGLGEAYLSVEGESASPVEEQHYGDGGEAEGVVKASEAMVDPDHEERNEHIDSNESGGETGEEPEDQQAASD
jgi:hypothetical protein